MLNGMSDGKFKEALNKIIEASYTDSGEADNDEYLRDCEDLRNFSIDWRDEQTIKFQLKALALIDYQVEESKWKLTPYGNSSLIKLRAIPKGYYDNYEYADETSELSERSEVEEAKN